MEIANTISQNNTILRLGLHLNTLGPRSKIQDVLTRNWDQRKFKIFYEYSKINFILEFIFFYSIF